MPQGRNVWRIYHNYIGKMSPTLMIADLPIDVETDVEKDVFHCQTGIKWYSSYQCNDD